MTNRLPRILLAASAAILVLGSFMHTAAFNKVVAVVDSSNLPIFYGSSLKALWLIDSATMIVLAVVFTLIAIRPVMARGLAVVLLALVPAATSALLYIFIGMFIPAHMLLASAVMAFLAGLLLSRG